MSSGRRIGNVSQGIHDMNLGSSEDGGTWEVAGQRRNIVRGSRDQWGQQTSAPRAWGQPDTAQRLGIRSNNAPGSPWNAPSNVSGPSRDVLKAKPRSASFQVNVEEEDEEEDKDKADDDDNEDEDVYSDDDDDLLSDGYDSDEIQTHEAKKQHRMLKDFFDTLEKLTVEQMNEPARQWHCPACQGGPGAIDWYKGLQPLMTHARTKGTVRVKLHRVFGELLDEELRRKGTSVIPAGESFGHWEGLKREIQDHDIVWPPMVMIMNTLLEKDENEKWVGMGNQELLDYFNDYKAVRAKHAYGPKGHRGMSALIFDSSAMGYVEAERLHTHFLRQGTGRAAWDSNRKALFYPGGKRQLYGFLARKDDCEEFNKHNPGKTRLKYDIRSYKEKVLIQMKQMSEDNQQLTYYKGKAAKEQGRVKVLEESFNVVSEKLRKTMEENRIVRQRTKMQADQNKEEMDFQAQFFEDQIKKIHEATDAKEAEFEKLQQEKRKKVEESKARASNRDDLLRQRAEEMSKFKEFQEQEIEKFVAEREELIKSHEAKKLEMKKRQWEEELQLEKDFDAALTKLMGNYAPRSSEGDTSAS